MAKQDDFIRVTVRIPPALHEKLRGVALSKSINAEIIDRLEASFVSDVQLTSGQQNEMDRILQAIRAALEKTFDKDP